VGCCVPTLTRCLTAPLHRSEGSCGIIAKEIKQKLLLVGYIVERCFASYFLCYAFAHQIKKQFKAKEVKAATSLHRVC